MVILRVKCPCLIWPKRLIFLIMCVIKKHSRHMDTNTQPETESPLSLTPQEIQERQVMTEVAEIQRVLIQDLERPRPTMPRFSTQRLDQIGNAAIWISSFSLVIFFTVVDSRPLLATLLALVFLGSLVISSCSLGLSVYRTIAHRHEETLLEWQTDAQHEEVLARKLLQFSRAALMYASASAKAREHTVSGRVGFLLGSSSSGGVLGALFVTLGLFSAAKYLQENKVTLPLVNTPITPQGVIGLGLALYFLSVMLMFLRLRVSRLIRVSELLERVAQMKKNVQDENRDGQA